MRTGKNTYANRGTRPSHTPQETKKPKRDTSADWVTIPRLVAVTLCALIVTIYFNGVN